MKKTIILSLIAILSLNAIGQRKIKKVDVQEVGQTKKIVFNPVKEQLNYNNLDIRITPISADELNGLFLKENSLNGIFEYSFYEKTRNSYFLNKKNKKNGKEEKLDIDYFIEALSWLEENDNISSEETSEFEVKILDYFYPTDANIEIKQSNYNNPYFISNNYLNVFKIEIENTSDKFINFDNEIYLENGTSILKTLNQNQIIQLLQGKNTLNINKIMVLERYNLPEQMSIPPKSKFIKYIAFLPMDYNSEIIKISIPVSLEKFEWKVKMDIQKIDNTFSFYEFKIERFHTGALSIPWISFDVLKTNSSIFLTDSEAFIYEKNLDESFEIISLSLYKQQMYFKRTTLKGSDLINKDKNKRSPLQIQLDKLFYK